MTSLRHDAVTRFTSGSRQRRFEHLIRHCGLQECKPCMLRGIGDGCQVRFPKHTVTYILEIYFYDIQTRVLAAILKIVYIVFFILF